MEQQAKVSVDIQPLQVRGSARWRIVGINDFWQTSSYIQYNVPPGIYTVEFKAVSGWTAPVAQQFTILPNSGQVLMPVNDLTATYAYSGSADNTGSLYVELRATGQYGEVSNEARWRIDGGPDVNWKKSNEKILKIPAGTYNLEFDGTEVADRYYAPSNRTITVKNLTNYEYAEFKRKTGTLKTVISPIEKLGVARWLLVGGPVTDSLESGTIMGAIPTGSYLLTYENFPGWMRPEDAVVDIGTGENYAFGFYYRDITSASKAMDKPENRIPESYGACALGAFDAHRRGTHILIDLPQGGEVIAELFTVNGRRARTLVNTQCNAGRYAFRWDGTSAAGSVCAHGTYVCNIRVRSSTGAVVFKKSLKIVF
jgi:flagellar hook assembly protein FlgD